MEKQKNYALDGDIKGPDTSHRAAGARQVKLGGDKNRRMHMKKK